MATSTETELAAHIDLQSGSNGCETPTITPPSLQRAKSMLIPKGLSCCQRTKLLLSPIQSHKQIVDGDNTKTVIRVSPEAFRMLFYIGFVVFTVMAIFTSSTWADIDFDDNVLLDTFGSTNICIFYDFPPFSYFGSTLWLPNVFLIVAYFVLDLFRIHDAFNDGELSSLFCRCYRVVTYFEIFAFCFFLQITATSPTESVIAHTAPFIIVTFAMWTLEFKRLLWFIKTGRVYTYARWYLYTAWIYVVFMFIVIGGKTMLNVPNMFGAQLWTIDGLEWTGTYGAINDKIFIFLTMVCPVIHYFFVAKDVEVVVMTIDRERRHWIKSTRHLIQDKVEGVELDASTTRHAH